MVTEVDKKESRKKWFTRDNLLILVLSGILLFIIAMPLDSKKEESGGESVANKGTGVKQTENAASAQETLQEKEQEDYVGELERELAALLEKVAGAGRVEVMLTLKTSRELVVEKDSPVSRSSTGEEDASGGSRQISQMDAGETTVYVSEGSESTPYVVKTIYPVVEGAVVVAEGAGNGTVNQNLSEMVQVLFNLDATKVKVVKMSASNPVDK